ncbi:16950_t:CDS:2, partial [Cetraspora pellucida]
KEPLTVWKHFVKIKKSGKQKCKRCPSKYGRNSIENHYIPYLTEEWQEHDDAITKWILCDLQPFTVIECKEWQDMIKKFDPHYQFHNRHTEKNRIVTLFENKREQVKLVLSQIPEKASFTSDMWTASNGAMFLSLTIHFVDSSWKLNSFLLDIILMEVRHMGSNMANVIMNVLSEFGLKKKTLALTTDNASLMIVCGELIMEELEEEFDNLEFLHYRCITHILNLVVGQEFKHVNNSISKHLSRYKDNSDFSKAQIAKMMYQKLESYWLILDDSSQISAFLDPHVKLSAFKTENEKNKVVDLVSGLSEYISETTQQIALANNSNNNRDYFCNLYALDTFFSFTYNPPTTNCIHEQIKKYLSIPLLDHVDPLCWWQTQHSKYPILSIIARDYLSIQATSIASEQAFSIAGMVISKERNRLKEGTARAILCLKTWICKG